MVIDPSKEFKLTDKKEIKENKKDENDSHPFYFNKYSSNVLITISISLENISK